GITILGDAGGERRTFATLKAACSAARSGDVIELQFNGRREEEPIELSNLKLTIRGGERFRPVIAFAPGSVSVAGLGRSMITVSGGRLTMLNVALELEIPRDLRAEGWSLFETRQAEHLKLEGCTLTIRHPSAAAGFPESISFFDIKAAPG